MATVRASDIPFLRPGVWAIALAALLLTFGYVARTELVVGSLVKERLEAEAHQRGIDVEVVTIRPAGLTGVRLVDVAIRVTKKGKAVEARLASIDVYPKLGALLTGAIVPSEIVVRDGHALLVDYPLAPKPAPKSLKDESPSRSSASPPRRDPQPTQPTQPTPPTPPTQPTRLRVELRNVTFQLVDPIPTKPLKLREAAVDWRGGTEFDNLVALGSLPDGQPFTTRVTRDETGTVVKLAPNESTRLDQWVDGEFPLSFQVSSLDVCIDCEGRAISVHDVLFGVPAWRDDLFVTTPRATFTSIDGALGLELAEVGLVNPDNVDVGARLTTTRVSYDTATGRLYGRVRLADTMGGTLDLDWLWTGRKRFELSFFADRFHSDAIWQLVDLPIISSAGVASGSLEVGLDLDRRTVALESALRVENAVLELDRLAKDPLTFPRASLAFRALFDWRGRALSLTHGRLELGESGAISFAGQLVDTEPGWSFTSRIVAESLNALLLRDALPWNMTEVLDGALLDGTFGFELIVAGHTEYPESLVMEGSMDGNVAILKDGDSAEVGELQSPKPPPGVRIDRELWRPYDSLPVVVPRVLIAAEDAKFFSHNGFDWPGLRRAMIHNLREGALERGGSTLSQQVVKNVFLSHDRTVARKMQEAYLTWRMEDALEKERILEIYLNIAHWGPNNVRGIVQAADFYFSKSPQELSLPEMALLAAILPNPDLFGGAVKEGRLPASRLEKMEHIFSNLRWMGKISPADYSLWYGQAQRGRIGSLRLEVEPPDPGSTSDSDE